MIERPRYLAYMLRLRQIECADGWLWRASIENAHTGEHLSFASLENMVAFLKEQMGEEARDQNEQTDKQQVD